MNVPDNYSKWEELDRKRESWLSRLPVCEHCGEPIQDSDAYFINGKWYHENCIYTFCVPVLGNDDFED